MNAGLQGASQRHHWAAGHGVFTAALPNRAKAGHLLQFRSAVAQCRVNAAQAQLKNDTGESTMCLGGETTVAIASLLRTMSIAAAAAAAAATITIATTAIATVCD